MSMTKFHFRRKAEVQIPVFELSDEEDLSTAWQKTIAEVEARTGLDLSSGSRDVEAFIQTISPRHVDTSTTAKAKGVFIKVLKCATRFGSLAFQASGVVFPGGQQVSNALSLVIQAALDYEDTFQNLALLMEQVACFLERLDEKLQMPSGDVSKPLRRNIYRVLGELVTIVVTWHQMTTDVSKRAKLFGKVLFLGEEGGIKESLATLQRLVQHITGLTIDEIHKGLSESARNLCDVRDIVVNIDDKLGSLTEEHHQHYVLSQEMAEEGHDSNSRIKRTESGVDSVQTSMSQLLRGQQDQDTRKTVRKRLDVQEDESYLRTHERQFRDRIPGTGTWLLEGSEESSSDLFLEWADTRANSSRVLGIKGPEGFGKSYLCNMIIDHLSKESKAADSGLKVCHANIYIGRELERPKLNQVVRYAIWQLATNNENYLKFVKDESSPSTSRASAKELWETLILNYAKKRPNTLFFIVLDGIDRVAAPIKEEFDTIVRLTRSIKSEDKGLQVRLLLSGRPGLADTGPGVIDLSLHNKDPESLSQLSDLREFVQREVSDRVILQEPLSESDKKLKSRILDELPVEVKGDYNNLVAVLVDIQQSNSSRDIEKALARVTEHKSERIQRSLDELNKRLDSDKIKQLNEIIVWVATSKTAMVEVDLLSAVLAAGNMPMFKVKLVQFMENDCQALFTVDRRSSAATVEFKSLDVENSLREESQMTQNIVTAPEVQIVKDILRTHFKTISGSTQIYDKFEFDKFFEAKLNAKRDFIRLEDYEENSRRLLDTCLAAICLWPDRRELAPLHEYAGEYFDDHLVNVDLAKLDPEWDQAQRLSRRLFEALSDHDIIQKWVTDDRMWGMIDWFLEGDEFCDTAVAWLKHTPLRDYVKTNRESEQWLGDISVEGAPTVSVLRFIGRHVLRGWRDSHSDIPHNTLIWLRGYWKAMTPLDGTEDHRDMFRRLSAEELSDWEEWAADELSNGDRDSAQWHSRIANLYLMEALGYGATPLLETAVTRCDDALAKTPNMWQAQVTQARAQEALKQFKTSLTTLERVVENNENLLGTASDYRAVYWERIIPLMGDCHVELQQLNEAIDLYSRVIQHSVQEDVWSDTDYATVTKLVGLYHTQDRFNESKELLEKLDSLKSHEGSLETKPLSRLLTYAYLGGMHDHVAMLAHRSDAFDAVNAYYERVKQDLEATKASAADSVDMTSINFNQLKLRWYCGPTELRTTVLNDLKRLIRQTSSQRSNESNDWYISAIHGDAVTQFAYALFDRASRGRFDKASMTEQAQEFAELCNIMDRPTDVCFSPRLVMARVRHLSGDTAGAREILGEHVRDAVVQVREVIGRGDGYRDAVKALGYLFAIVDDDHNTRVAWGFQEPRREATPETVSTDQDTAVPDDGDPSTTSDHPAAPDRPSESDPDTAAGEPAGAKAIQKELEGPMNHHCDGKCGTEWSYASRMWICKDCLDIQLCENCYKKLMNDRLNVMICGRDHRHVYIPEFDVDEWRARADPDLMRVGDGYLTGMQWLQGIVDAWGLGIDLEGQSTAADDAQVAECA